MTLLQQAIDRTEINMHAIIAKHGGRWTKDAIHERDILDKLKAVQRAQADQEALDPT